MNVFVLRRWLFSALLALVVMVSLSYFAWPGLNPDLWEDIAVVVGLRPAEVALAGTWRLALAELFGRLPYEESVFVLRVAGVVGGGIVTMLVYGILDGLLPSVIWTSRSRRGSGGLVVDGVLAGATLLFVSSEPVWRACQGAGPMLVQLVLALTAIRFTLEFVFRNGLWRAWVVVVLAGVLTGYGSFGFLLFAALWAVTFVKSLKNRDSLTNPLADPSILNLMLAGITFAFLALTVLMMKTNYGAYYAFGGVKREDFVLADMAVVVLGDYYRGFLALTSGLGAVLAFLVFVAPLVIAYFALPKVIVDDRLQNAPHAVTLFVMGVVAWSQISCFRCLWARQWFGWADISDGFTVAILSLFSVATLAWSYGTLLYNLNFCSVRKVAGYQFADVAETPAARKAVRSLTRFGQLLAVAMGAFAILALMGTFVTVQQVTLRRMLEVIDDYCREVVVECGEATRLITDGALDTGVELTAHAEGKRLLAISLLSGDGPRDVKIRQRDAADEDEKSKLELSGVDGLNYWLTEQTNRLDDVAIQFGFERRIRLFGVKDAWVSGLLARLGGRPPADGRPDLAEARRLMLEVEEICELYDPEDVGNRKALQLFRFVQWRLAQMARVRNAFAKDDEWTEEDRNDEQLAQRLDELNPSLQALKLLMQARENAEGKFLSPREGLVLGLQRADFTLARNFAQTVIRRDPEDAQANFAIGMYYLMAERHPEAIKHLETVLKRLPEDPIVLNNMALCYDRMKCPDKALDCAERALKAAPGNESIRENLERYRKTAEAAGYLRGSDQL